MASHDVNIGPGILADNFGKPAQGENPADAFAIKLAEALSALGVEVVPHIPMPTRLSKIGEGDAGIQQFNCGDAVAVERMAEKIADRIGKRVQFATLALPNNCEVALLGRSGDVLVRYIEDYLIMSKGALTDEVAARYDVLVRAAPNA